jgi:hypothetical protein
MTASFSARRELQFKKKSMYKSSKVLQQNKQQTTIFSAKNE